MKSLILASASPRRQQFLRQLGLSFAVVAAELDESPLPDERPLDLARRLAVSKAQAVAVRLGAAADALIIAADTVVALGEVQLGKPGDAAEAAAMLQRLRNRHHQVISAVSVLESATGRQQTRVNVSDVVMRDYGDEEIAVYVASGDPLDKAGAYAIQHSGFHPVCELSGCVAGVMGLPLADLTDLLAYFGVTVVQPLPPVCQSQGDFACCQARRDNEGQEK